ncbi:peptidase S24/S26A/S26B/S26C [Aspergillus varians]
MQKPPRFRVLSPEAARARSFPSSSQPSAPAQSPSPTSSPSNTSTSHHPSARPSPSSPRFSLFSFLRARYAALPRPARRTLRTLRVFAPILPIGLFFSEHVLQVLWVSGPSMTPYLNEDYETMHTKRDVVLVNMWPFGGTGFTLPWRQEQKRRLERGMVVLFRSPGNPHHMAIKRIIGLPGDRIHTREPCAKDSQIVPFNHVWVEGDAADPKRSLDSNTYGPVSVSLISGRVLAVLRPQFRWLDWSGWEKGIVEGDEEGKKFGEDYRAEVRERVEKGVVKDLERPFLS